uniref:Uncharacterized protein n=1 Tax=Arundo donax TaxID=35708 RepID=A0A0A9HU43_ARUDO
MLIIHCSLVKYIKCTVLWVHVFTETHSYAALHVQNCCDGKSNINVFHMFPVPCLLPKRKKIFIFPVLVTA